MRADFRPSYSLLFLLQIGLAQSKLYMQLKVYSHTSTLRNMHFSDGFVGEESPPTRSRIPVETHKIAESTSVERLQVIQIAQNHAQPHYCTFPCGVCCQTNPLVSYMAKTEFFLLGRISGTRLLTIGTSDQNNAI